MTLGMYNIVFFLLKKCFFFFVLHLVSPQDQFLNGGLSNGYFKLAVTT